MTGIYKITNEINGKCYIGQSTNLAQRIKRHIRTLLNGTNCNEHLQNAYKKYGTGNFTIEIIEECSAEELDEREIFWIDFYKAYDKNFGYNKTKGGKGGNGYLEVCDESKAKETKERHSESVKGERNPNYGAHCYTDGVVIKYIKDDQIEEYESNGWHKGVPDFVRAKERSANLGQNNGFYGKSHSDETKQKLSESRKGESNWNFGKVLYHKGNKQKYISLDEVKRYELNGWVKGTTEKQKRKNSESKVGRKMPEDVLRKKSHIYVYNGIEYVGWRKLQAHLRQIGYTKISEAAITKLVRGKAVRGYDDLVGKITLLEVNK